MTSLVFHVENSNIGTPLGLECVLSLPAEDGTITGRFIDVPKETLLPLLQPTVEGKVYTLQQGRRRYKVTELRAEGNFKLVPDFQE